MVPSPSIRALAKRYGLDFIILFGSQAKGASYPLSDIDIAVHIKGESAHRDLFNLQLIISLELCDIVKKNEVDVVILNEAPLRLRYEAFKHGRLIYCEDQQAYIEAYARAVDDYLDFQHYQKPHYEEAKRYFSEA